MSDVSAIYMYASLYWSRLVEEHFSVHDWNKTIKISSQWNANNYYSGLSYAEEILRL